MTRGSRWTEYEVASSIALSEKPSKQVASSEQSSGTEEAIHGLGKIGLVIPERALTRAASQTFGRGCLVVTRPRPGLPVELGLGLGKCQNSSR